MYKGSAFDCQFDNSVAKNGNGGAICEGDASGCKFTGCHVTNGEGNAMYKGTATNCEIDQNDAFETNIK